MTETREETGYTLIQREKKRVPISEYGKSAKAERAKAEIKRQMIELAEKER